MPSMSCQTSTWPSQSGPAPIPMVGTLTLRLTSVAFGEPRGSTQPAQASYVPMFAHLALVLVAGIYLPAPIVAWFQHVAQLLG